MVGLFVFIGLRRKAWEEYLTKSIVIVGPKTIVDAPVAKKTQTSRRPRNNLGRASPQRSEQSFKQAAFARSGGTANKHYVDFDLTLGKVVIRKSKWGAAAIVEECREACCRIVRATHAWEREKVCERVRTSCCVP